MAVALGGLRQPAGARLRRAPTPPTTTSCVAQDDELPQPHCPVPDRWSPFRTSILISRLLAVLRTRATLWDEPACLGLFRVLFQSITHEHFHSGLPRCIISPPLRRPTFEPSAICPMDDNHTQQGVDPQSTVNGKNSKPTKQYHGGRSFSRRLPPNLRAALVDARTWKTFLRCLVSLLAALVLMLVQSCERPSWPHADNSP